MVYLRLFILFCGAFTCNAAQVKDCHSELKADVVFVLDASGSIGVSTFEHYVKGFISDFVGRVSINSDRVRIGVYVYSKMCLRAISLNEHTSRDNLLVAIGTKIPYLGGMTATGSALHKVARDGFPHRIDGGTKLVIVITDGRANEGMPVPKAAREIKAVADKVIVVGVGNMVNKDELRVIATSEQDIYTINSYSALVHDIVDITSWACPNPCDRESAEVKSIRAKIQKIEEEQRLFIVEHNQKVGSLEAQLSFHNSERLTLVAQDKELSSQMKSLELTNKLLISNSRNQTVESMNWEITQLKTQLSSLEIENNKLARQLTSYEVRITNTRSEMETSRTEVTEMRTRYAQLQTEIKYLKETNMEVSRNIIKIQSSITKLEQERTRLSNIKKNFVSTTTSEYTKRINETTNEISDVRIKITDLQQNINSMKSKVAHLRSEKASIDKEHLRIKKENQNMFRTVKDLNKKVKELNAEIRKETELISTFRFKLKSTTGRSGEVDDLSITLRKLQTQLRTVSTTVMSMTSEIQTSRKNIEITNARVFMVQSRIRELEARIVGLREQITIRTMSHQTHNTRKLTVEASLQTCKQAIFSQGGVLALMVKANSGISVKQTIESGAVTNGAFDASKAVYKSELISHWSKSQYRLARIVLLLKGTAVVQLTFDARTADSNTFMSQVHLMSAYPWNTGSLQSQCCAVEGPHYLMVGNWTLAQTNSRCGFDGYFKMFDTTDQCSNLGGSVGPWFAYTTNAQSAPSSQLRFADEMRLYVSADGLISSTNANSEFLIFSYRSGFNSDIYDVLTGPLSSPPSFLSMHSMADGLKAIGWYKSESLTYFPRGKYTKIVLRLYRYSSVVAEIVFDSSSTDMNGWFSAANVVSAKSWALSSLRSATFDFKGTVDELYEMRMVIRDGGADRCNFLFAAVGPNDHCAKSTQRKSGYRLYYSAHSGGMMEEADHLKLFAM